VFFALFMQNSGYMYFDNLKEHRNYKPLSVLEDKLASIANREGANWLAARMGGLRKAYLNYLGKPRNISEAINRYNSAKNYDDKKINNADDLYHHIQECLNKDLRHWIEGEGAYDLIRFQDKVFVTKHQAFEKLVQRTIKPQIENILFNRGFQKADIVREPELIDGKRVDMLVRYGFAGPIAIEIKLTSNSDMRTRAIESTDSFVSMQRYMDGYYAAHGILLLLDNASSTNLARIKKAFQSIKHVSVVNFAIPDLKEAKVKKRSRKPSLKKSSKKALARSRQ
jgi:hypothetical protein